MISFTDAPINAYSWTFGAIAVYAFTIKSIASYERTRNPLARIYSFLGFFFGTAMLFFGFPAFLTSNESILKYTSFSADVSLEISVLLSLWLTWFIGLRQYISLKYIIGFIFPLSVLALTMEFFTSSAHVSQNPHLVQYTNTMSVLILQSIIYALVAFPLSYFLLKHVPDQITLRAKFQSLVSGLIPLIVASAGISNNIFDKGSDTKQSAIELSIFFAIFFLAQLPRPKGHS
ncbi:MAG: hypothetical protein ACHQT9_04060 [Candidatus Saccharimonadales bacterium]